MYISGYIYGLAAALSVGCVGQTLGPAVFYFYFLLFLWLALVVYGSDGNVALQQEARVVILTPTFVAF